ncbi:Hypothetical predicted protein [Cloeon dipterum]|uniref:C2H2-type domain-containing protein n=1 Tax=Cloeon dipterum TaxID=197152 RepID=A0A8S1CDE6_9INSE|nr:Hypothetical predicted protein [Cloeon dipterum]
MINSTAELEVIYRDGAYVCSACGHEFTLRNSCLRHFYVHTGETTCPICARKLSHKSHLKRHMKNVHNMPM